MNAGGDSILQQQIEYYRARAGEYDDWWFRRGRYDRGPALNRQWFDEVAILDRAMEEFAPRGDVLELAAGTGLWTGAIAQRANQLTALDASAEVLALNRQRVGRSDVRYIQADLFEWLPDRRYDAVVFAFWLSHVPPAKFDAFWKLVGDCLKPGGRAFFIDSLYTGRSTARDHQLEGEDSTTVLRRLDDGREFRIVKVFYRPDELERKLGLLGWHARIRQTGEFFLHGIAQTTPWAGAA